MDNLFSLENKTALITGGTSGIGLMIAQGLVERGVKTYITGRNADAAQQVANGISGPGACIGLGADLEQPEGPADLARQLAGREPKLDILINNAGAAEASSLPEVTIEAWDRVLNVNLRAAFFLVQQLQPLLRASASAEHPARVVNIGSIGGLHIPNWDAFPYGASKAALHHLTRALTKRLGREHIVVNAIAPGPFPSRLTNVDSEAVRKSVATYIPLGRAGEAADVQGLVVFLCSRAGAYVNGTTIPLDGGYLAAL